MADNISYLQIHVNGQQTFIVNEDILSSFPDKLRTIVNQERETDLSEVAINDFPGGPEGFELVTRYCYNYGSIEITVSNVALLNFYANFLEISDKFSPSTNLIQQTETFLEGLFDWSWDDLLKCLKTCGPLLNYAKSIDLVQKLIFSVLAKIAQNSNMNVLATSSSLSSSSSFSSFSSFSSSSKASWWFNDLTILPPNVIETLVRTLGAYREDNNSAVMTSFLLHYLKSIPRIKNKVSSRSLYSGLVDTVVCGVTFLGKSAFSCRGMFSVLRTVTVFEPSEECRSRLERIIGSFLDTAKLDDLLIISGNKKIKKGAYDVELVIRLVTLFVDDEMITIEKMKKVGRLIDEYLGEISPDQSLKVSRFIGVVDSLPDFARHSFDGVYKAIDIYLQSHPALTEKERSKICRCLNYSKLSLETTKDLAKNPKIPPKIAIQALALQHPNIAQMTTDECDDVDNIKQIVLNKNKNQKKKTKQIEENREGDVKGPSLEKMQWRVVELEKLCLEMKGQMSKMVKGKVVNMNPTPHRRFLPTGC